MSKLFWYIKQLFPLQYWSIYRTASGDRELAVWRMWLGRVSDHAIASVPRP